nr:hypothetical protein [Tanacetum cinerariifolium]
THSYLTIILSTQRKHKSKRKQRKETKVSQDEPLTEEHIPTPSNDLLPSVTTTDVEVSATLTTTKTTYDELTLAQTLIELKAAKPKDLTTAATTVTAVSIRPKEKELSCKSPQKHLLQNQ